MSNRESDKARRAALQSALQSLDPQSLEDAAQRLPKGLAEQAKALASQVRSGQFDPKALEGLLEPTMAALRALKDDQADSSVPPASTSGGVLTPILVQLKELQSQSRDAETKAALSRAQESGAELERALGAATTVASHVSEALRALSRGESPQVTQTETQGMADQAVRDTAAFLGNLGAAAQHAETAQDPVSAQLNTAWLAALDGLAGDSSSPLHQSARAACLRQALRERDIVRVRPLVYALIQVEMNREDWQQAAVYQHHLADLAESLGLMEEAVQARLKEALLLARTKAYQGSAQTMIQEQLRLTSDAPTALRARVTLHAGDVASLTQGAEAALTHWKTLLKLEGLREAAPELEIRAHLSAGYALLDSRAKRAARHFRAGWTLAFGLKNWELFGLAVEGLVLSQARAGLHKENREDHATVREQAGAWVGPEGIRRVDALWDQHSP